MRGRPHRWWSRTVPSVAVLVAGLVAACGSTPPSSQTYSDGSGRAAPPSASAVDAGGDGNPTATGPAPASTGTTEAPPSTVAATTRPGPATGPLPATPAELAAELSAVETELGRPGLDQAAAAPWGRRQQLLYRVLSAHPAWADEVIAAVDPAVQEFARLNWEARSELSSLVGEEPLATTVPAWEVGVPRPADELLGYYREAGADAGVPWEVLAAINLVETRMGRITGLSTAGAVGPMQFLPSTWEGCCTGDPTDPHDAIVGAATYLVDRGARRDLDRAIFGYNNSRHYVAAVRAYASVLQSDPGRYYGYHAWDVVFLSSAGLLHLPEGYRQAEPTDAATWLAANPDALITGAT